MGKILTITVPAYQIEKYIEQCLDSFLIEEVLDEIEVLIVIDGSTDQTEEKALFYQKKYPNTFRVIVKENGGHGSAVNRGILEARGTYFKVVDGDDWVEKKAFLHLIDTLKQVSSDIIASNYYWVYEKTGKKKKEMEQPFKGVEYQKEFCFGEICETLYIKMHALTIKTEILQKNNIRLDEHCFYVDAEYILYPIPFVETITFIKDCVYQYRVGLDGQSVNIKSMQKNRKHHLKVIASCLSFYDTYFLQGNPKHLSYFEERKSYVKNIINRLIASQYKIYLSYPPNKKRKKQLERFDSIVKQHSLEIYETPGNLVVTILRKSHFLLYQPIALAVRRKVIKE